MSQAYMYMFKHNVEYCSKVCIPHLAFRLYCIFKRFTYLLFLNEYTHMRKCVCLDTRLRWFVLGKCSRVLELYTGQR